MHIVKAAVLLAVCIVSVAAQCKEGVRPLAPRAELVHNAVTHGDLAGIVLKVWDPVAEGRAGGCVRSLEARVLDPSAAWSMGPSKVIDAKTKCNPCYYAHTAARGSKVTFRFWTSDTDWWARAKNKSMSVLNSDNTTVIVTAAGVSSGATTKHKNDGFLALRDRRIRYDSSYNTTCRPSARSAPPSGILADAVAGIDAAALQDKMCRVCGGLDKMMALCANKVYCKGIEVQAGQYCGVLKFPDLPYEYPGVQAAPGWRAYIRAEGWQERCDGCYD